MCDLFVEKLKSEIPYIHWSNPRVFCDYESDYFDEDDYSRFMEFNLWIDEIGATYHQKIYYEYFIEGFIKKDEKIINELVDFIIETLKTYLARMGK